MSKWPIRRKLLFGFALLLLFVATLAVSGFRGVYAYRTLVRSLTGRSAELPLASSLQAEVSDLRVSVSEIRGWQAGSLATHAISRKPEVHASARAELQAVERSLSSYKQCLSGADRIESHISDSSREWQTVHKIEAQLAELKPVLATDAWDTDTQLVTQVAVGVTQLQVLVGDLPALLHEQIQDVYRDARAEYRALIYVEWTTTILGALLFVLLLKLLYDWILKPLRQILHGSRQVAAGDFGFRIRLNSHDEMRELAEAMNAMTARFQLTRDDLDRQVAERTKQVIRSEQLASVGFLAAGVAHEINNPLASIAMCAESLEGRIAEVLSPDHHTDDSDRAVVRQYLTMIQDEAFRCKGITERLLDFARRGEAQRHATDLRDLVAGVIEMVGHIGKYHETHIEFLPGDAVIAPANSQELKQVVLNLLTNGLESLTPGGAVKVEVRKRSGHAEIVFTDNGCGMTSEVREHLFEPFFTRRRAGQGIGLGLSITYRIVADHQGQIDVHSDGPGKGSRFCVRLPLNPSVAAPRPDEKEQSHRYQAA